MYPGNKSKSILVVDDIEDVRTGLSLLLEDSGYHVYQAQNGNEAINEIRKHPVDLVVTDILMPERDGIELINLAREINSDLLFIIISGGSSRAGATYDYLEMSKKLTGIEMILEKPFKPEMLVDMVDRLLAESVH